MKVNAYHWQLYQNGCSLRWPYLTNGVNETLEMLHTEPLIGLLDSREGIRSLSGLISFACLKVRGRIILNVLYTNVVAVFRRSLPVILNSNNKNNAMK